MLVARLVSAGYDEHNVARWCDVPLLTDARFRGAPGQRPRRGLGGWIALWVAGEPVTAAALQPQPSAQEREALVALGLCDDDGVTLRPRATLLPWGGVVVASPRAEAFDVSALNMAASLPPCGSLWDVGCGAGLLALLAARAGARVLASDVDEELVGWARLNAGLNPLAGEEAVAFAVGDLWAAAPAGWRGEVALFNAPLLRAPLAVAGDDAPRYLAATGGEAPALRFLSGAAAHATDRVLLHAQLTPAVDAALDELARRAAVLSVVFAHAPDGTPHALSEVRLAAAPARRRALVPLSAACPHLSRAVLDGLWAPRDLDDAATPLPAPWLELRTRERFDGGRRALGASFGGLPIDADELLLLERLRGEPLVALGLTAGARERLSELVARGWVILR